MTRPSPDPSLSGTRERERRFKKEGGSKPSSPQALLFKGKKREDWKEKAGSPQHGSMDPSQHPAWAPGSQCMGLQKLRRLPAYSLSTKVESQQDPKSSISHPLPPFVPWIWLYRSLPLNPKPLSSFLSPRSKANSRSQKHSGHCQSAESLPHTPKATAASTLPLQEQSAS